MEWPLGNGQVLSGGTCWQLRQGAVPRWKFFLLGLFSIALPTLIAPRTTGLGIAPPTVDSAINHCSVPSDLPTAQSDGGSSSADVPSSRITLACVKLSKTQLRQLTVVPVLYTRSPELSHLMKLDPRTLVFPFPPPLASAILLSVSMSSAL